jgi:hypothetical protein
MSCQSFRCSALPAEVMSGVVLSGLPFLLSLPLSYYFLHRMQWKLGRAKHLIVLLNWNILYATPFNYARWSPLLVKLLQMICFLPCLTAAFWSSLVWYLLKDYYQDTNSPKLIAGLLAIGSLLLICTTAAFERFRADRFRLNNVTRILFASIILLLIALQLSITFVAIKNIRATYVLFVMGYSYIALIIAAVLSQFKTHHLNFEQMMRLQGSDLGLLIQVFESRQQTSKWIKYCYFISVLFLFFFGISSQYDTAHNTFFGWQIVAAIIYSDIPLNSLIISQAKLDLKILTTLPLLQRIVLVSISNNSTHSQITMILGHFFHLLSFHFCFYVCSTVSSSTKSEYFSWV